MVKCKIPILVVISIFLFVLIEKPGRAQTESKKPKNQVHSVLVICPFPKVEKRKILEDAFVRALIKKTGAEAIYPYIGTLSQGEEISREEFIERVNEKKIQALLFIRIKGIASNLGPMGATPDPFSPSSTGEEPQSGVYVPKGRVAKTWYQADLVDFSTGKSLWTVQTKVLGDIWISLKGVSKSMAKKTANSLRKTGLLAAR